MRFIKCALLAFAVIMIPASNLQPLLSAQPGEFHELVYRGLSRDFVSNTAAGKPDGKKDAWFHVMFNLPKKAKAITTVALYMTDKAGNKSAQVWHSSDSRYFILGVFMVPSPPAQNPTYKSPLYEFWGGATVQMDLFANDSGFFKPGSSWLVEIRFDDGSMISKRVGI